MVVAALLAAAGSTTALLSLDAITVEAGSTTLTSLDITHNTPSGNNRLLLVSGSWDDSNTVQMNATYNGTAMTCMKPAVVSGSVGSQMCYMVSPPTGDHTLTVSWGADVLEWVVVARSLTDVDQDDPLGTTTTATGSGTNASQSINTTTADSTVFLHAGTVDAGVSLDPAYSTVEDAEDSAGVGSTGISAAAGRLNTTTAGTYDVGFEVSSSQDWALDPAEVYRVPPKASFNASSSSGDESTSPSIDVHLDRTSHGQITVDYKVSGGNATSDDHNVSSGTLTFEPGTTWETIDLDITGDDSDEPDETLDLTLENPVGARTELVTPKTHTYTIDDDDPNHPPNPSDASVSTDEDTDHSGTVSASDQDQGDTVDSYAVDDRPDHGTVSLDTSTGDYTYSPDADYNGDDSFSFTATDNHGATSANATVSITVNAVNDAPSAGDDSGSTDEDEPVWVDVLGDDSDVDGDSLSVSSTTTPSHGTTSIPGNGTVKYTPDADWNGDDSFDYTVSDGSATATATVNVTVSPVQDAPAADDDSGSTDEDEPVWVDVLGNDTDVDGDSLSVSSATSPSHGTTSVPGNGTVKYSPDADWNGDDSFDYTVDDGNGNTASATVNVTVNAVDDAPTAADDADSTGMNQTVWVDVLANDGDPDGDSLSVASATDPLHGSTSVPGNGTVEYSPPSSWEGTASFSYSATDGSKSATATVNVTVGSPPEILSSSVRVLNTTLGSDPTLDAQVVGSAVWFQLENASGGIDLDDLGATTSTRFEVNLTLGNYTPRMLMGRAKVKDWSNTTNANGTENVTFEFEPIQMAFIDDCSTYSSFMGYCGPGSVSKWPTSETEDVADVNFDAAVRVFLSNLGSMNASRQEDLAGGYLTTDAQVLGAMNVSSSGTPSLRIPVAGPHTLPNGSTNDDGYFDARIPDALLDSWGISDTSALGGTYKGANKTVTVTDLTDYVRVQMDIHYSSGNVTIGEDTTDPTADAGSDQTVGVNDTVNFDGSNSTDNQEITNYNWTFDDGSTGTGVTPNHTYDSAGTYGVTLNVSDGAGNTDTDTVNITVEANGVPNASDDDASTDEDEPVWVDVLGNDSDPDGDSLTVASATDPSNGSTSVPGNGTVKYTPDADWNGDDSFEYDVSDGIDTSTATVNVTVNAVNDAPNPADDEGSTDENVTVWVDVLADDGDPDGDSLSVASVTSPSHGSASIPGNGTVEYTPDSGYTGSDSLNYTATDGSLTATATLDLTVTSPDNGAPSASDDSGSTDEDEPVWVDVLGNDSDPDGDSLTVASATSPGNGSTSIPGNGTVKYTPDADWNGDDSFDYEVSDGSVTDTATVSVTVNAVNDAPTASADSGSTSENVTVWVDVVRNDADVDGDSLSVDSVTQPSNGVASIPGNGTVEYTPDSGFSGTDGFTYDVTDGSLTDSASVSVNVSDGGGGGASPVEVVSSSVQVVNGNLSGDPTVNTSAGGSSIMIQLENDTGGIDLASMNATDETVLEINLTVKNFTPTVLMGRAEVVDWTNSTNPDGSQNVSFEFEPISMAFIDDCANYTASMGYCGPSSPSTWPTNDSEDQADVAFDAAIRVFVSDLSYLNGTMQDNLQGGYITTDAQALGAMNVTGSDSPGGASISIPVAGPHTLPNGTNNTGFFEARLPDALLSWWGIHDPSALTGEYQGADRKVTITNVTNGTRFRMDIHYSSGDVNITEDTTDPTADAGSDQTVTEGDSVSFDGSGSTDNQEITNYNWTFGDGSTGTGATPSHTYSSTGTYTVTLNVSDGAGNTDTDTVNVTVEAASTGGGGGGAGSSGAATSVDAANLSTAAVAPGENATVTADVTNTGDAAGWHTVDFQAGDTSLGSDRVHVSVDETETAKLTFSLEENGTYDVTADGVEAGTLTVGQADDGGETAPAPTLETAALAGETAPERNVTVTVANPASTRQNVTVALTRNDTTVAQATLTVPAHGSADQTLSGIDESGTYEVRVEGSPAGNVTVAASDLAPSDAADEAGGSGEGIKGATGPGDDGTPYLPRSATPVAGLAAFCGCALVAALLVGRTRDG